MPMYEFLHVCALPAKATPPELDLQVVVTWVTH